MLKFNRWNIILGWLTFLAALVTYTLTLEPTVSWWDCGEFISCSYKLLVGHPPGAPLFLMVGNIASVFVSDPEKIAWSVNMISAITSAFTILFLFWTITHLSKKLLLNDESENPTNLILVLGSGLVGSLAYAFSDSFWFSAVEGEVYASSSLFTAVVFWAVLKWENVADEKNSNKWLILIAYLMGLSIGVHLLNLLAIPAIVLVYYFRKYEVTKLGLAKAILLSIGIIAVIMYGIIQGVFLGATKFELLFVNGLGLGYNSGMLFYFLIIIVGLTYGIWYTYRKKKVLWNTIITMLAVIFIGYSSYAMIFVRSLANPPMDMNNPDNAFGLLSYLNREQYGDRPLILGHYFSDEVKRTKEGYMDIEEKKPVYVKDSISGRYLIASRKPVLKYDSRKKLLPRMYSTDPSHIEAYRQWGALKEGEPVGALNDFGFLLSYQLGHMYFRYFMWNFAGKQNDTQSHGSIVNGNWISGIKFIDELRLGNQDLLPDKYKNDKSRNTYYFLPFLLGLLGFLFQLSKDVKNFWVIMFLFFFTGIAIVVYLNQTPLQPRERDYAYAGSFYAFSIWIGLGVLAIHDSFKKYAKTGLAAGIIVFLSFVLVPGLMAKENWNDHDRSDRYTARDIAKNYLASCDKNAILFTNGDNDTYPLWYVQEVEGYRTDVRVVNLMLLNSEWNIAQMKKANYESAPLPMSLPMEDYMEGKNSSFYMLKDPRRLKLQTLLEGVKTKNTMFYQKTVRGDEVTVIPSNRLVIPVDTTLVLSNGTVDPENAHEILSEIDWIIPEGQKIKSNLAVLDILGSFGWERPIYFVAGGNEGALNLEDYFQLEGLAYKLVPIKTAGRDFFNYGRIETEKLHENLMNKFSWGGMEKDDVYLDYYNKRTFSVIQFRKKFVRLAEAWLEEGDTIKALEVLDRCMELSPNSRIPYDYYISGLSYPDASGKMISQTGVIETYYKCGAMDKGNELLIEYIEILQQDLHYYEALKPNQRSRFNNEYYQSRGIFEEMINLARKYGQESLLM
ncbi:MAG: DUF2723 domain-containing protein [Bacteroidales bacterium]|nr:DUF2723 domain-containing protein [Bacteroidales bacterium]MCF8391467.1 DUF2723 domain-containing protein [Bacteroidales bacterium]